MNGVLPVDKPEGVTSHDVVELCRERFNIRSVGHAGTLDPDASGLLLLLLGEGTKLSQFFMDLQKTYEAKILLGVETDTHDRSGNVLRRTEVNVDEQKISDVLKGFVGEQFQVPPVYSAIKVRGKPSYKYARSGIIPELSPRKIFIKSIELKEIRLPEITVEIVCSKGTYIRSIARDVGNQLGCGGILSYLRRTRIGPFMLKNAVTMEELRCLDESLLSKKIVSLSDSLSGCIPVVVEDSYLRFIKNARVDFMKKLVGEKTSSGGDIFKFIDKDGHLLALVRVEKQNNDSKFKILRMFNEI